MKNNCGLTFVVATALAAFVCAAPAHAGSWQLTSSAGGSDLSGSWGTGLLVNTNTSTAYDFEDVFDNGSTGESGSFTYTGSIQWVGGGTQPSSVTLTETSEATACGLYSSTAVQTAVDGLGDASSTSVADDPYPTTNTESEGTHQTVVPMSNGEVYHFTRTLSASSYDATINECYVNYSISIP
ncbi:MAG: hypothetical protein ACLQVD_22715 [Capsulimonadaceae bacterium]